MTSPGVSQWTENALKITEISLKYWNDMNIFDSNINFLPYRRIKIEHQSLLQILELL